MGPCLKFKQFLLYDYTPTANTWHKKTPVSGNLAVFTDDLTRIRKLHPRTKAGRSDFFTTSNFVRAILEPHLKAMSNGVNVVISAWDDPSRVPRQKSAEHKKRDARLESKGEKEAEEDTRESGASKVEEEEDDIEPGAVKVYDSVLRYPPGTTMSHAGLLLPGAESHVHIDLQRLANTRHMRVVYLSYLRDYLIANHRTLIPEGAAFVLDHFASGPILFTAHGYRVLTELRHPFGEADMMSVFWCRVLRHMDVYINTIDGDLCLLLLNYARHHEVPHNIWYRWEKHVTRPSKAKNAKDGVLKKKLDGYVDIKEMLRVIGSRLFAFTVATILCKTDFHEKNSLIKGIGDESILKWGMRPHAPITSMADATHESKWDFTGLLRRVENLWTYPLASTRVMPTYRRLTAETKGVHLTRVQIEANEKELEATTVTAMRELERALVDLAQWTKSKPSSIRLHYAKLGAETLAFNLQYWLVDLSAVRWRLADRSAVLRFAAAAGKSEAEIETLRAATASGPSFVVTDL
jgi:hypothetical protein